MKSDLFASVGIKFRLDQQRQTLKPEIYMIKNAEESMSWK